MTEHTGPIIGCAWQDGVGMCYVEPLRAGSPTMRLIPFEYDEHYTNNPLTLHRDRVDWRPTTTTPTETPTDHKEAA